MTLDDNFWAQWNDLDFHDFLTMTQDFLVTRLTPETRLEGCEQVIRTAYGVMKSLDEKNQPRLLSAPDFMKEIGEPPPALIPDFLPACKLILVAGAAKEGKSLVALEFLHRIAAGEDIMSTFPIEAPLPVAYFGLEDGGPEIKLRLAARGAGHLKNLFVCWEPFDMNSASGFAMFESMISEMPEPPKLVVIDTYREAFSSVDNTNDDTAVKAGLSRLRRWAHKNCTVLLIHHTNKDRFHTGVNKIAGSGAIVSCCDGYAILSEQTTMTNSDLQWKWEMGGRGMVKANYMFQMDTNTLHVRLLSDEEIQNAEAHANTADKAETKRKILVFARDLQYVTALMTAQAIGLSYNYARQILSEMAKSDKTIRQAMKVKEEGMRNPVLSYVFLKDSTGNADADVVYPPENIKKSNNQHQDIPPISLPQNGDRPHVAAFFNGVAKSPPTPETPEETWNE